MDDADATVPERRTTRDIRTPVVFVSLGSSLALTDQEYELSLRRLGHQIGRPRAIIALSSDWQCTRPIRVTASEHPSTLEDFDAGLSSLVVRPHRYPGSPGIAAEIVELLAAEGLPASLDRSHGLGFGVWMPAAVMFPTAVVPVVQISQPDASTPDDMLAVGRALVPLRRRGVLLMGSGGSVCDPWVERSMGSQRTADPRAVAFDAWVRARLDDLDIETLRDYRRAAPQAYVAAPTSRYLDALFFVLGSHLPGDRILHVHEGFHAGNLSLRACLLVGRRKDDGRIVEAEGA
jgi:4,5-DOPA dioxygenase extradiol